MPETFKLIGVEIIGCLSLLRWTILRHAFVGRSWPVVAVNGTALDVLWWNSAGPWYWWLSPQGQSSCLWNGLEQTVQWGLARQVKVTVQSFRSIISQGRVCSWAARRRKLIVRKLCQPFVFGKTTEDNGLIFHHLKGPTQEWFHYDQHIPRVDVLPSLKLINLGFPVAEQFYRGARPEWSRRLLARSIKSPNTMLFYKYSFRGRSVYNNIMIQYIYIALYLLIIQ
jgi:hypothetical protein